MLTGDWFQYKNPYNHFKAFNVLEPQKYNEVATAFQVMLKASENNDAASKYKLRSGIKNYDALILGINWELAECFRTFFSQEWLSSLSSFLNIPFLPRIEGGFHSHPLNSRTGWIHTDFCSAWFDESNVQNNESLIFPNRKMCEYFSGKKLRPSAKPVEYVRAATMIFYLCNDNWKPGNGGETALYGASVQKDDTAFELVPPLNNSLILFECSPHSYHRFVTNPLQKRNSIILWIHTTLDLAQKKWGNSIDKIKS